MPLPLSLLGLNDIASCQTGGAKALANGLRRCDQLEKLILDHNNIETEGAKALANSYSPQGGTIARAIELIYRALVDTTRIYQ